MRLFSFLSWIWLLVIFGCLVFFWVGKDDAFFFGLRSGMPPLCFGTEVGPTLGRIFSAPFGLHRRGMGLEGRHAWAI